MRAPLLPLLSIVLLLAGCAMPPAVVVTESGTTGRAKIYRINSGDTARIQFRMLDSVNTLRSAAGLPELALDGALNAAAATHARDMSSQNRPWHFGSDGSSPIDRAARAGYPGLFKGELISETYETELETLAAWMEDPLTRRVIMDPTTTDMGFGWEQESNGKLWWTMVLGGPGAPTVPETNPLGVPMGPTGGI